MVPPVLPDAVACFPDAVCAVLLRPERFLCRVTEQSIEDADAAKHLPGSLFHNGPLVVVRVRVKGGPCRQQTYGLQRVFVRLPPQKAGHFRVGCPVRIHLLGILGQKLAQEKPVGLKRLRSGMAHGTHLPTL